VPTQWSVKLLTKDHNAWDDAIAASETAKTT